MSQCFKSPIKPFSWAKALENNKEWNHNNYNIRLQTLTLIRQAYKQHITFPAFNAHIPPIDIQTLAVRRMYATNLAFLMTLAPVAQ